MGDITGISVNRDVLANDTITDTHTHYDDISRYGSLEVNCQTFYKQLDSFASANLLIKAGTT